MSFLRAEWRKLAIANYEIAPSILAQYIPYGTELDLWQDKCYVSLVGFMFLNVKVIGLKIPFHRNFEEANLRFYVKRKEGHEWKRGVVFIKEIVPKPAISFIANTVYRENYETLPMRHVWEENAQNQVVEYAWQKNSDWYKMRVEAGLQPSDIQIDSETEFITEHYWGYAKVNDHKTNEYQVTHPRWQAYDVLNYEIKVNFGLLYGTKFAFLSEQTPTSVMLAEGSEITVEPKETLK